VRAGDEVNPDSPLLVRGDVMRRPAPHGLT